MDSYKFIFENCILKPELDSNNAIYFNHNIKLVMFLH